LSAGVHDPICLTTFSLLGAVFDEESVPRGGCRFCGYTSDPPARLQDYANVWRFVREVHAMPEVKPTCNLDHIKTHYYWSQTTVNPSRIVPLRPALPL
jgi:hypothetical protein